MEMKDCSLWFLPASGSGIQWQLHKVVEDQHQYKEERKENMEQMTTTITTHIEQVAKALTALYNEQQK